jgi:hypothetical protein
LEARFTFEPGVRAALGPSSAIDARLNDPFGKKRETVYEYKIPELDAFVGPRCSLR